MRGRIGGGTHPLLPLLAVLGLVITGCGSAAPVGPAGTGTTEGATAAPSVDADPLPDRLTFRPDDAPAGSGDVSFADGGSIATTAADGTRFRLDVPPMAVAGDVTITMTSLAEVVGLTHEPARVHAVQLQPDGLRFLEPVRLTIEPATPIALDAQLAFEAEGDGAAPGPGLIDPTTRDIVLVLQHFTVEGVAQVTPEQRRIFRAKSAANATERLQRQVRELLADERVRQLTTGEESLAPAEALESIAEEYQREVLDKLRLNVSESCASAEGYVREVLSWERQRQLVEVSEAGEEASLGRIAEALGFVQSRFDACEREAVERCRASKDPSILVSFWVTWGLERSPGMVETARDRCLGSDYRIDRTVTASQMNVTYTIRYTATKCGGPTGDWVIDSAGTLSGYGGTASIGGPVHVTIEDGSMTGPVDGIADFHKSTGGVDESTQGRFVGTATFVEDPATLRLDITGGTGNGYPYGYLETGLLQPGTLTLPLEEGRFCE
jgi:hypothetical protein